jgi:hypothetical protein
VRADPQPGHPVRVRVTVVYRSATAVPVVGALVGDRTLRGVAVMRVEHAE